MKINNGDYSETKKARLEMIVKHVGNQIEEFVSQDPDNTDLSVQYELVTMILVPLFMGLTFRDALTCSNSPGEEKTKIFFLMADNFADALKASFEITLKKYNEKYGHK